MQKSGQTKPKVVILGAGYGGAACARALESSLGRKIDLTVVDKRQTSVHKMAAARASVLGNTFVDRILIPNKDLVLPDRGLGQIVYADILKVTESQVFLSGNQTLDFDYLVCATGAESLSVCEPSLKITSPKEMKQHFEDVSQRIKAAREIVLIGGGAVGVELSGEIKFEYPDKKVTIVHAGSSLINKSDPPLLKSFNKGLMKRIRSVGIDVLLDSKADVSISDFGEEGYIVGPKTINTNKGQKLNADLVLLCTGTKLNNAMYPDMWKDEKTGMVKVRRTFQVFGRDNIFAIGDITNFIETKQGFFAGLQGQHAAMNIKRMIKGYKNMKNYSPGFGTGKTFIFIALGRKKGISNMGYLTLGSFTTSILKAKTLFVEPNWAVYRQGKHVPKEIGGPSKGGKKTVVA